MTTDNSVELVGDGDGIAVLGSPSDIEMFLSSANFDLKTSRPFDVRRLAGGTSVASGLATAAGEFSANSGRWVKLTKESAEAIKKFGLTPTKTPGINHAMVGPRGDIKQWLQIAASPSALLAGPVAFPMLASIMSQQAMQQQMDLITEYLEKIDEKLDDVLRAQKDSVLADMIGVDLVIADAMTVRERVGRVSSITWSKVQSTSLVIARTQGYALRQLDAISEKLSRKAELGQIAAATTEAEPKVREWLAVLARCFQLLDAIAVIELDHVADSSPTELDVHRQGLTSTRRDRIEQISRSIARLLATMDETIRHANSKVLLNPFDAPRAVRSSGKVAAGVLDFRSGLGIDSDQDSAVAKRWRTAVGEARDKAVATGVGGASAAKQWSGDAVDRATTPFRHVDIDGDGIPDRPRAAVAAEEAGSAIKVAASGVAGAVGTLFQRRRANPAKVEASDREVTGSPDAES